MSALSFETLHYTCFEAMVTHIHAVLRLNDDVKICNGDKDSVTSAYTEL